MVGGLPTHHLLHTASDHHHCCVHADTLQNDQKDKCKEKIWRGENLKQNKHKYIEDYINVSFFYIGSLHSPKDTDNSTNHNTRPYKCSDDKKTEQVSRHRITNGWRPDHVQRKVFDCWKVIRSKPTFKGN